jgi:histone H3/H4
MRKISKATVKGIVNGRGSVVISDSAAAAIAKILESKASRIARYAVKRARQKKRGTVLEEDIESYRVRFGD